MVPTVLSLFSDKDINQVFEVVKSSNTMLNVIANANRIEETSSQPSPRPTSLVSSIIRVPLSFLQRKCRKRKEPPPLTASDCNQHLSDEIQSHGTVPDTIQSFLYTAIRSLPKDGNRYHLKSITKKFFSKIGERLHHTIVQ